MNENNVLPSEDFHFGHMLISYLSKAPDHINQIEASSGKKETNASVLSRSVRLAKCLRSLGYQPGDVMALGGRNHLDLHIPHLAALLNGLPLLGVDPMFKYDEIYHLFDITKPKIAFCQLEQFEAYKKAVKNLGLDTRIVTFDEGELSFAKLMETQPADDTDADFEPAKFDLDKIYTWLLSTGGTTGAPKVAAFKYRPLADKFMQLKTMYETLKKAPSENNIALNVSPVQWLTGFFSALSPVLLDQTKLQTSAPQTTEHIIDIINKYKPVTMFAGPSLINSILGYEKHCDLTCFNYLTLIGGKVYTDLLISLKPRMKKDALIMEAYGLTECMGPVLRPNPWGPLGNCGQPSPSYEVKLVDPETEVEITEPNVPGEFWMRGPSFSEYYNNPEETAKVKTEDGWNKTGDILYRDAENNYFFVERMKLLIKYRSYHVVPLQVEELIRTHPAVHDTCVTSIPHEQDGEHPVAAVVRKPGYDVTAQEIKDLVANKLSESQQLRGGVVFMDELLLTSSGKVARAKIRQFVLNAKRE